MNRRTMPGRMLLRVGATAVAAILVGFVAPTSAQAPREGQQEVAPAFEAWYQADPTCETPVGCLGSTLPAAPPTIYPARTLHVGTLGGQEIARSYLAFFLDDPTAELTAAKLSIPLDVEPTSGSQLPDQSRVQACVYTGSFINADGSLDTPPEIDCEAGVVMEYAAEPEPRLVADLKPLLSVLPTSSGLALVPGEPDVENPTTGAWRVVFSAGDRADAPTGPAVLTIAAKPAPQADPGPSQEEPVPTDGSGGQGGSVTPNVGSGGVAVPVIPVENAPPVKAVEQPAPPVAEPAPVAAPLTEFVGYAYPLSWTVPLLIVAMLVMAGRELTRDLGTVAR